jgi:hypothetical protein
LAYKEVSLINIKGYCQAEGTGASHVIEKEKESQAKLHEKE